MLAKQRPHVEPDDPDSFIIALLDVDKKILKNKKQNKLSSVPPDTSRLIQVAAERERELFSGGCQ